MNKKDIKVFVASDHAGFFSKEEVKRILELNGYSYEDLGPNNENSVDYPKFAQKVGKKVSESHLHYGILICGSGTGMQIAANKVKGVRAAFCYDLYSAKMARQDNDANILTLRAREFDHNLYEDIVNTFLETSFSLKERHINRLNLIEELENGHDLD